MVLKVESAGFGVFEFARFYANGKLVATAAQRGVTIVVLNPSTFVATTSRTFDTNAQSSASSEMASFIGGVRKGDVVLVGVEDEGQSRLGTSGYAAFQTIGGSGGRMVYRAAYAIIGIKGMKAGTAIEAVGKVAGSWQTIFSRTRR